jgi:NAD(P)-dependent dehydrogenase (short-subunit alcohol dehydrogenase family)
MKQPWKDKLAILSGGSSGFGLHIALALAQQGARMVIVGRDRERLERSRELVCRAGAAEALAFSVDITDEESWNSDLGDAAGLRCFVGNHSIDLLVNIVGRSDRGLLETMSDSDLIGQFHVNVLSAFRMTKLCLPSLKRAGGTVVDIASLAGILAGPGMGGYSLSKHALVGMHRQWRIELYGSNVHFLLVCPGPIERDDGGDRYSSLIEARNLDSKMSKPGGGVRLKRLEPAMLARRVVDAAAHRKTELIIPSKARWLVALMSLCPSWGMRILRNRFK